MFCKYCGAQLPEDAHFCGACGKSLAEAEETAFAPAPEMPAQETPAAPVEPAQEAPVAPAQPAFEAAQPAPENPVQPAFVAATPDASFPEAEAPQKPKRNAKRILTAVIAAVVVLAIIGGGIAFAMDYFSPESKLERALDKTGDALDALFDDLPNLSRVAEIAEKISETKSLGFTLGMDEPLSGSALEMRCDVWLADSLRERVSFHYTDGSETVDVMGYAVPDSIQYAMPGVLADRYVLPIENLALTLPYSYFGRNLDEETAQMLILFAQLMTSYGSSANVKTNAAGTETLEELERAISEGANITVEEVEQSIRGAGALDAVYSYNISYSGVIKALSPYARTYLETAVAASEMTTEDMQELMMSLNMVGSLLDSNVRILVGVRDGCATAFSFSVMGEELMNLQFDGGSGNPFESIRLSVEGEELLTGSLRRSGTAFTCTLTAEGETLSFSMDDAARTMHLSFADETLLDLSYNTSGEKARFDLELYDSELLGTISITLEPAEDFTVPNSAEAKNILTMSEADFEALAMEFLEAYEQ